MVYLGWTMMKPSEAPNHIAILALVTSCLVEVSQFIQTPWLNALRHTTLGYLILGMVFSWYDIFAYVIGVILGLYLDNLVIGKLSLRK
jgi:hypothetical protein